MLFIPFLNFRRIISFSVMRLEKEKKKGEEEIDIGDRGEFET